MPAESPRGPRRRAFTLTELLVVFLIIAVLTGLLLPALARARESANAARCLSNLHQIGIAVAAYEDVNRGAFPTRPTRWPTSAGSPGFAEGNGSYDPTKDPFFAGGTYPDIQYEMVGFRPVLGTGASPGNELAYDVPVFPTGYPAALPHQDAYVAAAGAPAGYSDVLDYQYSNHIHGVELYSLDPGSYDLELIAHDATGQFTDSTPVYLQVTAAAAVPEPAGVTVAVGLGLLCRRRPRRPTAATLAG